jgi:hypothetical protein
VGAAERGRELNACAFKKRTWEQQKERGREREVYWNKLFPIKAAILVGELIAAFLLNERSLFRAGLDPKVLAKWYCSVFRCYLTNIVKLWFN